MKKVFLFLSAITLAFSSCSDDENSPNNPPENENVLIKRIIATSDDPDGINYNVTYSYDGNKLLQGVYTDGMIEKYYYTGDLITKTEFILDGEVEERELFSYDQSGRLIEYRYQTFAIDDEERNVYTYTDANTATVMHYGGSIDDANSLGSTTIQHMQNGEITSIEHEDGATYNYTYDSKNSPFKNVTGYAAIVDEASGDFELFGKNRNIASIVETMESTNYMTNVMQYNADNYPTSAVSTAIFETVPEELTVQFIYE